MLRLLQMAFLGEYISKIFRGGMHPDPPSRPHAFGARLHDHSHDAGFATVRDIPDFKDLVNYMDFLYLIIRGVATGGGE